jgi:hypothetical protein
MRSSILITDPEIVEAGNFPVTGSLFFKMKIRMPAAGITCCMLTSFLLNGSHDHDEVEYVGKGKI